MKNHYRRQRQFKKERKRGIAPLSNFDILDLAAKLKIPHFRGVFMRDTLPKRRRPAVRECWILNQASSTASEGSHWCGLAKSKRNIAFYFDPMGGFHPRLKFSTIYGMTSNFITIQKDIRIMELRFVDIYA